jgi:hypothetical protein
LDCIINENGDGRRKITHKRRIATLEEDRALLVRLVNTIRDSDETEVSNLISIIRNGASLAEINAFLIESPKPTEPCLAAESENDSDLDRRNSDVHQGYLSFHQLLAQ